MVKIVQKETFVSKTIKFSKFSDKIILFLNLKTKLFKKNEAKGEIYGNSTF